MSEQTKNATASTAWTHDGCSHQRDVGPFQLHVWPLVGAGPFQAWVYIPGDGDSQVLPSLQGFASAGEAKKEIERDFVKLLEKALKVLKED